VGEFDVSVWPFWGIVTMWAEDQVFRHGWAASRRGPNPAEYQIPNRPLYCRKTASEVPKIKDLFGWHKSQLDRGCRRRIDQRSHRVISALLAPTPCLLAILALPIGLIAFGGH
jgi:hypothetical protein